jgi:capsid protein
MALLSGSLKLSSRDPSRYMSVRHRPRGWQWIDPEKEAKAAVLSIQNGLGTRTGFLAEKGEDIEDVFAELAREQALAKEYGLSISGEPVAAEEPTEEQPKDSEEPEGEKDEDQAEVEDEESSNVATA